MAESDKPQIIVLEPSTKTVEDLLKLIEEKSQAEIIRVSNADEAQQLARHHQPCMLVACIQENAEIPSRVNMLKKLEGSIKKGQLKTLFVSKLKNRQINTLITSLGVTDFMEEPVPVRTMAFKANLQLKAVQLIKKQQAQKVASEERIVFKKTDQKKDEDRNSGTDTNAKGAPALQLEEDTFLFKNSGAKKFGKKTMVELEGPAPETGEWVPHEDKGNAQTSWRWVPNEEKEKIAAGDPAAQDGWVHEGEKPQFQEATGKWQMASEKPELSFRKNGAKIATKVSTDEAGELVVAADSPAAEKNLKKSQEKAAIAKKEAIAKELIKKNSDSKGTESKEIKGEEKSAKEAELQVEIKALTPAEAKEQAIKEATKKNSTSSAAETTEIRDLTQNGEPAEVVNLQDRRGADKPAQGIKKGAVSPLDFLKKKKELLEKSGLPASEAEETVKAKDLADSEEEETEILSGKSPTVGAAPAEKAKKSAASAAQAMLDRMKAKLGNGPEINSSETEETSGELQDTHEEQADESVADDLGLQSKEKKSRERSASDPKIPVKAKASSEKNAPALKAAKQARKKELLKDIQEILKKPLPEKLPSGEKAAIRKKLGLENQPEISDKDLARRARIEQVKDIKSKLGELDLESSADEFSPETNVHDLSKDDLENTWSEKSGLAEKAASKRRAFDSDLKEEEAPGESIRAGADRVAKEKSGAKGIEDKYVYLPRETLTPQGGAWEAAGSYYVFLGAEVRYRGFKNLEDLLPLWIYSGERVPELLDKTNQWRFLSILPLRTESKGDIPREVRDFLLGLRDQLVRPEGEKDSKNPTKAEKKKGIPDLGLGIEDIAPEEENNSEEEISANEATDSEDETTSGAEVAAKKKNSAQEESSQAETKTDSPTESSPTNPKEARGEKKRDLSKMLASLEEEEDSLNSRAESSAETEEIAAEKKKANLDEANDEIEEKVRTSTEGESEAEGAAVKEKSLSPESTLAEDAKEKAQSQSLAITRFEERRKRKKEKAAEEKPSTSTRMVPVPENDFSANPYLGIFVTLSNSLGPHRDPSKPIMRVLRSIESSFGTCSVGYLQQGASINLGQVLYAVGKEVEVGSTVELSSGLSMAIRNGSGEAGDILGYLYLKPISGRKEFTPPELTAMGRVAECFSAVVVTDAMNRQNEKKAA